MKSSTQGTQSPTGIMSRHRIVRTMNYEDEYYDDDEEYSRSVEDNYCISPSTAAQFTWNRDHNVNFAAYMGEEQVIDEAEEFEKEESSSGSFQDAVTAQGRPKLSDTDQARLNSCLEEMHNILGETVSECVMVDVILQNNFNVESSLNQMLLQQDAPKPQREPRQNRRRNLQVNTNLPAQNDCVDGAAAPAALRISGQTSDATSSPTKHASSPASVVTPSKPTGKATIGFHQGKNNSTPSSTASSTKASAAKNKHLEKSLASRSSGVGSSLPTAAAASTPNSFKDSKRTAKAASNDSSQRPNSENVEDSDPTAMASNLRSAVEFMGLEGEADVIQSSVDNVRPMQGTPTPQKSKSRSSKLDVMAEYANRHGNKELLNLVVIGHVDAGKSTLMGHLLYQLGSVNKKTMHKYEQESKKMGKSSFAFAWVLDETEEERSRGVTMDVAQTRFETEKKIITLLDAPGHKDFIPNMITGASQADVAILVINATKGEFETGFDAGGQTREHALLARSLGVGQIIVAVNKMDTVGYSEERYQLISKKIGQFLSKQAGFKESDVTFVPCSGLSGENLTQNPIVEQLTSWYSPPVTLLQKIDNLWPPSRPIDKPFRLNVSDVFKGVGSGFNISGRVGSGYVQSGDKVLVLPAGVSVQIKSVFIDDCPSQVAFAGDHVNVTLSGVDMANVNIGNVLCDPASPSRSAMRIRAKIVIFNIDVPITKGFPVVFHYQSVNEPAIIKRLTSHLNRNTGEVLKNKPRCLMKNSSAVVEIEFERALCLELYAEFKDLGRFMLRNGGHTIAAGLVEEIVQSKTPLNGAGNS